MAPLEHTSAQVLEFGALRDLVRGYAFSPLGQGRVSALEPVSDLDWIEDQQQMAAEIREFLRAGGRFDFAGLLDPRKELSQARIEGAALDPTQIREILLVADRADEWNAVLRNPPNAMRGPEGAIRVAGNCPALFRDRRFRRSAAVVPQQDQPGRDARRSCLAGAGAHPSRNREAAAEDTQSLNRLPAETLRRRHAAGRTGHYSRRAFRHPGEGGAEAAGAGRGARREFERPDGVRRAAGDDRAEQRTGAAAGRELEEVHRILLEMTRRLGEHAEDIAHATICSASWNCSSRRRASRTSTTACRRSLQLPHSSQRKARMPDAWIPPTRGQDLALLL